MLIGYVVVFQFVRWLSYFATVWFFLLHSTKDVSLGDFKTVSCRKVLFVEIHEFH